MIIHLLHFAGGRRHGGFGDLTCLGAFQVSGHLTASGKEIGDRSGSKQLAQHETSKSKVMQHQDILRVNYFFSGCMGGARLSLSMYDHKHFTTGKKRYGALTLIEAYVQMV